MVSDCRFIEMKLGLSDLEMILQENGEDTADCSFGGFHRGVELRTTVTHKSHLVVRALSMVLVVVRGTGMTCFEARENLVTRSQKFEKPLNDALSKIG